MLNLSLNEMKLVSKSRGIKDYKSMSKERLSSALSESESVESKNSFHDKRLKQIRKGFTKLRDWSSKPQIKEIRKNHYDIKNPKNLSTQKIKEIEESLFKLEERLSNFKKYRPQDDFEHTNIKDIRNVFNRDALNKIAFNQSIDEDYYRSIRIKSAFNDNYIEYESKGNKDKNLSPKEYLDMIRPYFSDIINNYETPKNLRVHSLIEVIDYET